MDAEEKPLEELEVGPCKDPYELGFLIGQRFSRLIRSRVAGDLILQQQLLPFSGTPAAQRLLQALSKSNQERYPRYWDELVGTAEGSGVSFLDILLLNFRKEILPFIPKAAAVTAAAGSGIPPEEDHDHDLDHGGGEDDCSDIAIVNDDLAMVAHNEDANVVLVGHTYIVKATLPGGPSFTAYTYAGELPSCAFGFNSHGLAFTLDSVPPCNEEILEGGIGRNFVSRDLLEATCTTDALRRICTSNVSVGHSYNLADVKTREIVNVETASGLRSSVREVGKAPFFHANMYLHLQVQQVQDENSISRERRAAQLSSAESEEEILSILGDTADEKYPIYMRGPILHTLCTAIINLDKKTLAVIHGNPKNGKISRTFPIL